MRRQRSYTLFASLSSVLALLFLHNVPGASANKFGGEVGRFIDDDILNKCNVDLERSDQDANGELDSDEYVTFVKMLSEGRIDFESFMTLPLRLRMIYHWAACSCIFEPGANDSCCIGPNSHVNVEQQPSTLPYPLNDAFCCVVVQGVREVEDMFPTLSPSPSPTNRPTRSPTASPSTKAPSGAPSQSPTIPLTPIPTDKPTGLPSTTPSTEPPETLCIGFQYELMNNRSLSAEDIFNEVNNTIKTGLEIATREIVIEILNETFPRDSSSQPEEARATKPDPNSWKWNVTEHNRDDWARGKTAQHDPDDSVWGVTDMTGGHFRRLSRKVELAALLADSVLTGIATSEIQDALLQMRSEKVRRLKPHLQAPEDSSYGIQGSRRLVYYSDDYPVEVTRIVDRNNCPTNDIDGVNTLRCAIVSTTLCVVLEDGDDPVLIRRTLVTELGEAIEDGSFEDKIPPENFEAMLN